MPDDPRPEDVYVVRVRREGSTPGVRGYVDDVTHGGRLYFTTFHDLAAFLQARIERGVHR